MTESNLAITLVETEDEQTAEDIAAAAFEHGAEPHAETEDEPLAEDIAAAAFEYGAVTLAETEDEQTAVDIAGAAYWYGAEMAPAPLPARLYYVLRRGESPVQAPAPAALDTIHGWTYYLAHIQFLGVITGEQVWWPLFRILDGPLAGQECRDETCAEWHDCLMGISEHGCLAAIIETGNNLPPAVSRYLRPWNGGKTPTAAVQAAEAEAKRWAKTCAASAITTLGELGDLPPDEFADETERNANMSETKNITTNSGAECQPGERQCPSPAQQAAEVTSESAAIADDEDPYAPVDLGWYECRIIPNPYQLPPLQSGEVRRNSRWRQAEQVCLIDEKYGVPVQPRNGVPSNVQGWARLTLFETEPTWLEWFAEDGVPPETCRRTNCLGGVPYCTGFSPTKPTDIHRTTWWQPKNPPISPWYRPEY